MFSGLSETKIEALASYWLRHFRLFLCDRTGAVQNSMKLDSKQDLNVLLKVCVFFFDLIGKPRWPPWALIGWDIFDFSETAEWKQLLRLDRKNAPKSALKLTFWFMQKVLVFLIAW